MSSDAATDYDLVHDLLQNGMDCMRINCAHDGPEIWLGMIRNLRKAQEETGLSCRVLMDLAGPKLRTGPIEPGPAVVKSRPIRDVYGRVVTPARIWLTPSDNPEPPPESAAACIPLSVRFLKQLRTGDTIHLRDARRAKRTLRISRVLGRSCWAESGQTIYFKPGVQIYGTSHAKSATGGAQKNIRDSVGDLPALPQVLLLKPGDTFILERGSTLRRPATYGKTGELIAPASIGVSLPQMLADVNSGEPVWLDDGKIGGVFRSVTPDCATVEILQARPEGEKLGAEKALISLRRAST
jgi:pyruvate kinase